MSYMATATVSIDRRNAIKMLGNLFKLTISPFSLLVSLTLSPTPIKLVKAPMKQPSQFTSDIF